MPDAGARRALRQRLIDARLGLPGVVREAAQQALAQRLDALAQALLTGTAPAAPAARAAGPTAAHAAGPAAAHAAGPTAAHAAGPTAARDAATPPILGVFVASRGEPDLTALYDRWRARGWRLALPRVVSRDAPLEFGAWPQGGALVPDRFGIPVPAPFEPAAPCLLVVPCVGFDPRGWRLGYGGGFYDRTLAALGVPAVGVAFDDARLDGFEPAAHDRPLAAVVTPSAVWGGAAGAPALQGQRQAAARGGAD